MVSTELFDLSGKVALLTGASKGMGLAMAQGLAEHGARVVISSRKLDQCEAVAQEIKELEALGEWEEGHPQPEAEKEITYDFPITMNRQVEYYLDRFQNSQRKSFRIWLQRSGRLPRGS